jgi:transposase
MPFLDQLRQDLPARYYLGIDIGYKEHVAVVIPLAAFLHGGTQWQRARCLHFASTQQGLAQLDAYLAGFSADRAAFLGLCEPTGGYYGATLFEHLIEQGYPMQWIDNGAVHKMRDQLFPQLVKTDEMDPRVMARIGYLHEAVGEEFNLRPLVLPSADDADLLALCRDHWKLSTLICRARNQFTQLMAVVFPELKTFFTSSVSTLAPVQLMARYASPADLSAATVDDIAALLHQVRAHKHAGRAAELQALARTSAGVLPDAGRVWRIAWLTTFLRDNFAHDEQLEKRIEQMVRRRADYGLVEPVPYAGPGTLGLILAATGDVNRFSNYRRYVAYTGYFAGLEVSQTIDRTKMSKRGNRDLKRALFQIVAPLVWLDKEANPYKTLYQRKLAEGRPWYSAMPFACAALARHLYHCLKTKDPYDVAQAFRRPLSARACSDALAELHGNLDDKIEEMEASLSQMIP